jgi:MarR family transcriptional regulator, transcriptional regulator for hemolysin
MVELEQRRVEFITQLFRARNRFRLAMDDELKPKGITDATWRTLFYLEQQGDGITQKDLALVMGIEGPGLVRLLDRLEARQLLERRPDKHDRRAKTVHLTRHANDLLEELHLSAAHVRGALLKDVSSEELDICLRVLAKMTAIADSSTTI